MYIASKCKNYFALAVKHARKFAKTLLFSTFRQCMYIVHILYIDSFFVQKDNGTFMTFNYFCKFIVGHGILCSWLDPN